jgi:hypothetical protein
MDRFVTVLILNNPIDLIVLRTRLEDEGIDYLVPDELTTQVNPLYSVAVGGVRLQVRESQVSEVQELLKELGYWEEQKSERTFLDKFDSASSHVPFLNTIQPLFRFLILVTIFVLVLLGLLLKY